MYSKELNKSLQNMQLSVEEIVMWKLREGGCKHTGWNKVENLT